MGNFKSELTGLNRFQPIPRDLIQDCDLSAQARFIYSYMAAKPEGWEFWQDVMSREVGMSVATLRKYLYELRDAGWLEIGGQNNSGKWGAMQYTLKAVPYANFCDTQILRHAEFTSRENCVTQNLSHLDNKDSLKETDTYKEKKSKPTPAPLTLPFDSEKFRETWEALCEEKEWKKKTLNALRLALKDLGKYEEEFAIELMEKAIKGGWKGVVFADTPDKYLEWKSARQKKIDNAVPRTSQPVTVNSKAAEMQARLAKMREQAQQQNEEP